INLRTLHVQHENKIGFGQVPLIMNDDESYKGSTPNEDELIQWLKDPDELTSFIVTGTVRLNNHVAGSITTVSAFVTRNLCTNLILDMDYLLKYD
ncbi:unnamed protein product, partial [Rotaria sp. Silwood1]